MTKPHLDREFASRGFQPPVGEWVHIPLWAGERCLGILTLDNALQSKDLHPDQRDLLRLFGRHAATALERARLYQQEFDQRRKLEGLLGVNYAIMTWVSDQPLKKTLSRICQAAQALTGADRVAIYPLKSGVEPFEFDKTNIGRSGKGPWPSGATIPRRNGLTSHILRAGTVVVPDIDQHYTHYGGQRLSDHPFLQSAGIHAFIGTPVNDVETYQLLGALFLNYRTPQVFTEREVQQAELFATLAAVAIRNARRAQLAREGLALAERRGKASERELAILRLVLEEALTCDPNEDRIVRALLNACHGPRSLSRAWPE